MCPFFFLLPPVEQGRGRGVTGGAQPAALGLGGGQGVGERREGGPWVRFPAAARVEVERGDLATTAGGWRAAVALGRRPGGVAAVKEREKSERGPRGSHSLPRLGLGRSEEGCPRRWAEVGQRSSGGG